MYKMWYYVGLSLVVVAVLASVYNYGVIVNPVFFSILSISVTIFFGGTIIERLNETDRKITQLLERRNSEDLKAGVIQGETKQNI